MDVRSKCDQVMVECLVKITQVILQARISFPPTEQRRNNKWFHTDIEEIERISDDLTRSWKTNIHQPLCLDIYFHPNTTNTNAPLHYTPLMERWKLSYDPLSVSNKDIELPTLYKHLVLLYHNTESLLSTQFIIKDYQPSDQPSAPTKVIDVPTPSVHDTTPYEAARSAPIGIPGKGRDIEDPNMALISSPPSSLPSRYGVSPSQNPLVAHQQQQQQQLYKYSSSLPSNNSYNNQHLYIPNTSTPPTISSGLPFPHSANNNSAFSNSFNNNPGFHYLVGATSSGSTPSTGSMPLNHIPNSNSNTPTNYGANPSNNVPSHYSTPNNNVPYVSPPSSSPARPRASSSNATLSTTPPFPIPLTSPLSTSTAPTLARSNSISNKSPPFRLSISPFKEPPFGGSPSDAYPHSHSHPPKPKPNMKVSALVGLSMIQSDPPGEGLGASKEKGAMMLLSNTPSLPEEPAFAIGASINADSEIGEFIKLCHAAPPLKMYSAMESRATISRLFLENNFSELSKLENMDINTS